MARRRGGIDERPLPARPYRDTVVVYGIMAIVLVVIAGLTGGSLLRAFVAGIAFFMLATGWSWWRFRERIKARDAREAYGSTLANPPPGRPEEQSEADSGGSASNGAANGNGKRRAGGER